MTAIVKVSTRSVPNAVAGALAGLIRIQGRVEVQVVGAGALNQAIKAIAIARTFMVDGEDLCCRPSFADIEIDGEARTAIRLLVERVGGLHVARIGRAPADGRPVPPRPHPSEATPAPAGRGPMEVARHAPVTPTGNGSDDAETGSPRAAV